MSVMKGWAIFDRMSGMLPWTCSEYVKVSWALCREGMRFESTREAKGYGLKAIRVTIRYAEKEPPEAVAYRNSLKRRRKHEK